MRIRQQLIARGYWQEAGDTGSAGGGGAPSSPLNEHSAADLLAGMIDETGLIKQPENDTDEQTASQADDAAGDEQAQQETASGQPAKADQQQTVTVLVNGVETEVPLSEVIAAYQGDAGKQQQTTDQTEQRQQPQPEQLAISQERAQISDQLNQATALLTAQLQQYQNMDWNALLEQDPQSYLRARHDYDSTLANLQMVQQQRGQLDQLIAQDQEAELQQQFKRETEALAKAFPQWSDPNVAKAEKAAIREYLAKSGFRDDEISQAGDHRAIVLANKARLYDELMAKGATAVQKAKATPLKVEKPGGNAEPTNKRADEARARAARSGRAEDAAAALLAGGLIR